MPLTALPRHHDREGGAACTARTVRSWSPDARLTDSFAAYGDDASGADDGTGDGTHSVRLPDGRVLWLFADTCLGQVYAPPNPVGEPYARQDTSAPLVRNAAVVMHDGHLQLTLPAPLLPDPAPNEWRRPVAARVEPRSPRSPESVVHVLLWTRAAGPVSVELRRSDYDVDWLDATAASAPPNLSRNVSLYRPRFVTLRLGPPTR